MQGFAPKRWFALLAFDHQAHGAPPRRRSWLPADVGSQARGPGGGFVQGLALVNNVHHEQPERIAADDFEARMRNIAQIQ
jgi:hypothetical protein